MRWTDDSLRVRITPTELRALLAGDRICGRLAVAGKTAWELAVVPTVNHTILTAESGSVTIAVSELDRRRLAATDQEGVYFTAVCDERVHLRYYIEKDFPCTHPGQAETMETPGETFPRF